MLKSNIRVVVPRNPADLITLAGRVLSKHASEGTKSALSSVKMNELQHVLINAVNKYELFHHLSGKKYTGEQTNRYDSSMDNEAMDNMDASIREVNERLEMERARAKVEMSDFLGIGEENVHHSSVIHFMGLCSEILIKKYKGDEKRLLEWGFIVFRVPRTVKKDQIDAMKRSQ